MPAPSQWTFNVADTTARDLIASYLGSEGVPASSVVVPQVITYRGGTLSVLIELYDDTGAGLGLAPPALDTFDFSPSSGDPLIDVDCLHLWGPPDGTGEGATRTCLISGEEQILTWVDVP